jgi:hypothetical protein
MIYGGPRKGEIRRIYTERKERDVKKKGSLK